jgi:hypothetical protein
VAEPTYAAVKAALALVVGAAAWIYDNVLEGIFTYWGS